MKAFQKGMREGKKMKEKGRKRGKKERSNKRTENRGMVGKKGGIESKKSFLPLRFWEALTYRAWEDFHNR